MQTPHIDKFVDMVRVAQQGKKKEITLTLKEAQDISANLTKLLVRHTEALEKMLEMDDRVREAETLTVELDGKGF